MWRNGNLISSLEGLTDRAEGPAVPWPRLFSFEAICAEVVVGAAVAGSAGSEGFELLAEISATFVPGSQDVWVMVTWEQKDTSSEHSVLSKKT